MSGRIFRGPTPDFKEDKMAELKGIDKLRASQTHFQHGVSVVVVTLIVMLGGSLVGGALVGLSIWSARLMLKLLGGE